MKAKSFVIRLDNKEQFEMLTDEQCGKLLKALIVYADTGEVIKQNNQMLEFAFSVFKGQIDRDFEKYEETCRKRSESGKRGGAPKGNQNAARADKNKQNNQMLAKQAKQANPNPNPNPNPKPNPKPNPNNHTLDSVCECDCAAHDAQETTAHTTRSKEMDLQGVMVLIEKLGFSWSEKEAQDFLAYNMDKGRTMNWGYAAQRWEANRERKGQRCSNDAKTESMNEYLTLVNRFKEDEP